MFSKAVHEKMNDQIQAEMYSAYLYLSMAAQFETQNLPGFAHWMRKQAAEELEHALKFFDFVNDQPVADSSSLLNLIAALKPGIESRLTVARKNQSLELRVKVDRRPAQQRSAE